MRIELNKDGYLHIYAETGSESYALRKWTDDFYKAHPEGVKGLDMAFHLEIEDEKIFIEAEDGSIIDFEEVKDA